MPKANSIRADAEHQAVVIKWKDGTTSELDYRRLRDNCPCAECANLHGPPDPLRLKLAPNYELVGLEYIGNYAVQPRWGDGHNAGLYSWNYLRELAGLLPAPQ